MHTKSARMNLIKVTPKKTPFNMVPAKFTFILQVSPTIYYVHSTKRSCPWGVPRKWEAKPKSKEDFYGVSNLLTTLLSSLFHCSHMYHRETENGRRPPQLQCFERHHRSNEVYKFFPPIFFTILLIYHIFWSYACNHSDETQSTLENWRDKVLEKHKCYIKKKKSLNCKLYDLYLKVWVFFFFFFKFFFKIFNFTFQNFKIWILPIEIWCCLNFTL